MRGGNPPSQANPCADDSDLVEILEILIEGDDGSDFRVGL